MKRYTDEDVRRKLLELVAGSSYARFASQYGLEQSHVYRQIHGQKSLMPELAAIAGFVPTPVVRVKRWERKSPKEPYDSPHSR